ncbi:exodeoxyribonuclease VII large subunit [Bradymonas sediminis]|uniref:Exodeoxyribonuclease 7 large subunit n=1 Tax=Bradymonas sediminis TaxID=1548548 RepID=A0A2Z4FKF2_9DELT|nr:exodeoxyribonuclease VII large subunit [Bradymonas sediminis]AWV89432.1 exodeoxyribonuclease VII large subunit [Bradymonas sediminis]TDP73616.1 exodeoxyribonuclease VII large subunit [Bradymonas sediminis]
MSRLIDIEIEQKRVCVKFPYNRDLLPVVRTLPGRWFDRNSKDWYVPLEHVAVVIAKLSAHHFKLSAELRDYCEQNGTPLDGGAPLQAPGAPASAGALKVPEGTYSISQLNEEARQALRQKFSDDIWLVGEIQNYDKNRATGHAYFELVERLAPNEDPVARLRVVMFRDDRQKVERALAGAPEAIRLRDGLAVRLAGRIDLYAPSGSYQFIINNVDPTYTTGEIHQNRERVLAMLDKMGIRERNQRRPWAPCPLRVGLITSAGSDAYNDFVHELERTGFGFEVHVHNAKVQGTQTEPSVLRALDYFARHAADYDVLAIVRGGGSRSDLAYFDTEAIGKAVCEHPLKIIVGVGHQRDQCVLDFVAESQKTPTAAAQACAARVQGYLERVEKLFEGIAAGAVERHEAELHRLRGASTRLERAVDSRVKIETRRLTQVRGALTYAAQRGLVQATRRVDRVERAIPAAAMNRLKAQSQAIDYARSRLSLQRINRHFSSQAKRLADITRRLDRRASGLVLDQTRRLEMHRQRLRLLDPQRVLERGFSIVSTEAGVALSPDDIPAGAAFRVRLAHGEFGARRTDARKGDAEADVD